MATNFGVVTFSWVQHVKHSAVDKQKKKELKQKKRKEMEKDKDLLMSTQMRMVAESPAWLLSRHLSSSPLLTNQVWVLELNTPVPHARTHTHTTSVCVSLRLKTETWLVITRTGLREVGVDGANPPSLQLQLVHTLIFKGTGNMWSRKVPYKLSYSPKTVFLGTHWVFTGH